jgi:TRAP-type C4-dicarboxylate transport system substrate-binding protein
MTTIDRTKTLPRAPTGRSRFAARFAALLLSFVVAGAAGTGTASAQTATIKVATATLNDAQHQWMRLFAAEIETATHGRLKAELYPASQLGSIPRMIEGTQLGSIQVWVGPPEFLVGVDPRFELLSAPGLFESSDHALRTIADPEFSKAFLALGSNKGLISASLFFTGPTVFDMRTPVHALADIKGKKVRVLASPFQMEQLTRLGATGVPLTLADVLPALQQGTLDGAMGALPVFSALQYQDSARYMFDSGQSYIFSEAFLSKRWFDALPADLKAAVMAASNKAAAEAIPWALQFLTAQRQAWVEKGGEVIALSPADRADLMAKMRPIGADIVNAQPALKPLYDLMVAAARRTQ